MVWVELLRSGPDIDGLALYRDAPAPRAGPAALEAFSVSMPSLVEQLRSCEPDKQCWWFAGSVPMMPRSSSVDLPTWLVPGRAMRSSCRAIHAEHLDEGATDGSAAVDPGVRDRFGLRRGCGDR
jgi:hypothetical protein